MEKTNNLQLLTEIIAAHQDHINPSELESILNAVKILKENSGWGEINISFTGSDLKEIQTKVTEKFNIKKKE